MITNKTILVTGGTGSFGQKFTEIILRKHQPRAVRIFSRDELKQKQMAERFEDERLRFLIGDVRDPARLARAMEGAELVIHAAAMKQVPACEYNPFEAVKTNILGAQNVIEAAIDHGVERVLALSSDKAVNPVNLYGATKLCAEKIFIQGNSYVGGKRTRLSVVRYGNVVGSRGSVIPLFLDQRNRGTVTITDVRMTRFWITLEQGVEFVLRCLEQMRGGEILVPKIPSMRIIDLVEAVAPESERQVVGIRAGEKIHEALLTDEEVRRTWEFEDFFLVEPEHAWWRQESWEGGKRLPEGFRYSSDSNTAWLSKEQLRTILLENEFEE